MPKPTERSVFIVRPFGVKEGIDFDAIETKLIREVLRELGFPGGTTGEFAHAGSILVDMMQQLLLADVVIADISIHNANVYYELGVRHALRDRATILIRCASAPVPFDLKTERYLVYDKDQPEASRSALKKAIEDTIARDVNDSPVFQQIPEAKPHDIATLAPVPRAFQEAVKRASETRDVAQLWLMAGEVSARPWRFQALSMVGLALFNLKANKPAIVTYERVRAERPDDAEANSRLATLFERVGDLPSSDLALDRVDALKDAPLGMRRESLALRGRNRKVKWIAAWTKGATLEQRQRTALASPLLAQSLDAYRNGFLLEPASYYAGINALTMLLVQEKLAEAQPATWNDLHAEDDAGSKLKALGRERQLLTGAVAFALKAAEKANAQSGTDSWLLISKANHLLLSDGTTSQVQLKYEGAAQLLSEFNRQAEARQLTLLRDLGLFKEQIAAALGALGFPDGVSFQQPSEPSGLVIVGTGHRIDAEGRNPPRFPNAAAEAAKLAIRNRIEQVKAKVKGGVRGMAAIASGADTLFHEVCADLGIPVEAYLPLTRDEFKQESVADGGFEWKQRFDERYNIAKDANRLFELGTSQDPPPWVDDEKYGVFQRGNLWLLDAAFAVPNANVVLIALWSGTDAEGAGGTADMVKAAKARGADVRVIHPDELKA